MNVNKQLKLLEIRREIERLICRSAAKRASDSERQSFRRLADEFAKYAARNDDVAFVRADREFNELWLRFVSAVSAFGRQLSVDRMLRSTPSAFSSRRLLEQCRSFAQLDGGTGALPGAHDDLVMAAAIACAVRESTPPAHLLALDRTRR